MSEDKILEDLSVDNISAHVEHIVTEIPGQTHRQAENAVASSLSDLSRESK